LSAAEEKVVATIRRRFVEHFTPDSNFHYKGEICSGCDCFKTRNLMSTTYKLRHRPRSVNCEWRVGRFIGEGHDSARNKKRQCQRAVVYRERLRT
jgi:hypothetical protein